MYGFLESPKLSLTIYQAKMRKKEQHTYCNWHGEGNNTKWQNKEQLQSYLGSNQLEECKVYRKHIDVCVDGSLVKRTCLAMELVQAGLAHGVRAT